MRKSNKFNVLGKEHNQCPSCLKFYTKDDKPSCDCPIETAGVSNPSRESKQSNDDSKYRKYLKDKRLN